MRSQSPNRPDQAFLRLDGTFVALVDGTFQDAARRSGPHLLCRAGCHSCCVGVFPVGPADALRLQQGMLHLEHEDPQRAADVRARANASWSRLRSEFPGDPSTGRLNLDTEAAQDAFESYGNDEVCPVLDPVTGRCDIYAARPHTCRSYGPPIRTPEGYGVCELCFTQASQAEIMAAAIAPEPEGLAEALDRAAIQAGSSEGESLIAWLLMFRTPLLAERRQQLPAEFPGQHQCNEK